jgi:hypothetical protein
VEHYNDALALKLNREEKSDLEAYLKSL